MNDLVAVTTIRQGNPRNPVEKARAEIFLDTARALARAGIPCVALHVACTRRYLRTVENLGVFLIPETEHGMGFARRQALRSAAEKMPASYYLWIEPEKPDLPRFARRLKRRMEREGTNLGLFMRTSLRSYPEEQALYYAFCRAVASKMIGLQIDYGFGPMVIARRALDIFLSYRGDYGDQWDSILIPRLRILKRDRIISTLTIPFQNDPRMTEVESGNAAMILKRVGQFTNVIPSLIKEWQKLDR